MGRKRDPNRDKAFEIYKSSNGEISLIDIAAQLGVSDGTVRGWKAKDNWENLLTGEIVELERSEESNGTLRKNKRNAPKKVTERSNNTERSKKKENDAVGESTPEPDEEETEGFTQKQRLFVKYYLINFNASQAAIKAGYSSKAAKEIGYRLLTYAHIKEAIKKYTEEISFEIGMNVQRTIMEYMKIAFSDITEFVEFGQKDEPIITDEGPAINPDTGEPMTYKRSFVAFKESNVVDGTLISEVKQGKDGVSVKLHDKMKALEMLTKYHDLLPDKHKRMIAEEKLKLDKERLELDKQKAAGEGDLDEELIDDWVEAVMDDDETGGDEETSSGVQKEDTDIPEESEDVL